MIEVRPAWHAHALCNTGDGALVDVFFGAGRSDFDGARAKQICAGCTVRPECLDDALDHPAPLPEGADGVRGGLTHAERLAILRRQGRPTQPARPVEHGTNAGYMAHLREGEDTCPPAAKPTPATSVNASTGRVR